MAGIKPNKKDGIDNKIDKFINPGLPNYSKRERERLVTGLIEQITDHFKTKHKEVVVIFTDSKYPNRGMCQVMAVTTLYSSRVYKGLAIWVKAKGENQTGSIEQDLAQSKMISAGFKVNEVDSFTDARKIIDNSYAV